MPRLFCFLLWIIFSFVLVHANAGAPKPVLKKPIPVLPLQRDTSSIHIRSFNKTALDNYAKEKDFQYNEPTIQGMSAWDRFWHWVWGLLGALLYRLTRTKSSWFLFKTIIGIIAAAVIAFIIFKILGIDVIQIFRGKSKGIAIPYSESLENIHEINFDSEIDNAVSNRNYRLAVRLLYLRCLKQLSDAQLIHWQIEKTNSSYLNELNGTEYRQMFGLLTTQFEYVWYGDFPVDSQSFQHINTLFIDLKKALP